MRKLPLEYPLYDSVYSNGFPLEQLFIILFDEISSHHSTKTQYSTEVFEYFKNQGFVENSRVVSGRKYTEQTTESLFINNEKQIIISTEINLDKSSDSVALDFYYNLKRGELSEQLNISEMQKFKLQPKRYNIKLVRSDMHGLDTEEYDLPIPEIDLALNYGKNFLKIHETILRRLTTDRDKGIILLHGLHGTGKTSYIRYLTKLVTNKPILFIPPSMAAIISEPSIVPFLMENRNSILLIEDAEEVIGDRRGKGSAAGVSNILNLTDGILGDCLNIQVIATCNMVREKIDPALLRKGRLICEHMFDKLSVEDTNILLEHLNKGKRSDKGLCLADIYNIDSEALRITPEERPIGLRQ